MENSIGEYVYHGSPVKFDFEFVVPRRNLRTRISSTGESIAIFDQESFHATSYKWIALSYTYKSSPFKIGEIKTHYSIGVSLYENNKKVYILGRNSLEESLEALYGEGGYLYYFNKDNFFHKEGLGNLEVIIEEPIKPAKFERIDDPVSEMKKLGVTFVFFDLFLPENEKYRN